MDRNDAGDARRLAQETAAIVDPLLADVWGVAWSLEDAGESGPSLATLLRMAYLQGYGDALSEDDRGSVFRRLGVAVPPVRPARSPARRSRRS